MRFRFEQCPSCPCGRLFFRMTSKPMFVLLFHTSPSRLFILQKLTGALFFFLFLQINLFFKTATHIKQYFTLIGIHLHDSTRERRYGTNRIKTRKKREIPGIEAGINDRENYCINIGARHTNRDIRDKEERTAAYVLSGTSPKTIAGYPKRLHRRFHAQPDSDRKPENAWHRKKGIRKEKRNRGLFIREGLPNGPAYIVLLFAFFGDKKL